MASNATTAPKTYPSAPIELPLRLDVDPNPVDGCALCANQARQRDMARANGNASKATDLNVRMRRHFKADHS
ncbi:hypothetical protein [Streptomyces sp. HGB0020]|jgi:hypothetical protein|uniref:hypothetical protein n=1 Tax=Streptomyces sp. HGB0020 TaxID=1078086 RepID=UPI00034E232C|nr:hypothetical protein [Streptomyces sp. HGB0020]EPD60833.1 hypothetical protein HMPREF1211_04851 [Streptomyces sp. HGB0020]